MTRRGFGEADIMSIGQATSGVRQGCAKLGGSWSQAEPLRNTSSDRLSPYQYQAALVESMAVRHSAQDHGQHGTRQVLHGQSADLSSSILRQLLFAITLHGISSL